MLSAEITLNRKLFGSLPKKIARVLVNGSEPIVLLMPRLETIHVCAAGFKIVICRVQMPQGPGPGAVQTIIRLQTDLRMSLSKSLQESQDILPFLVQVVAS